MKSPYIKIVLFVVVLAFLMLFIVPIAYAESSVQPNPPELRSEAAILMNGVTGEAVFSKEANKQMYPASITKIATAIVAIEEGHLADIVTVSKNAREVEGTRVYLEEGEQISLKKLIQGMMINSGNDAAIAIAEHLQGTESAFAAHMTQSLTEQAGITKTNFTNPHGLFGANHVTTAHDMALITKYGLQNTLFRDIFGTKEMAWKVNTWDTTIVNHNALVLGIPFVTGGKTGYVSKSGHTLVTSAKKGDEEWIAVVLNAPSKRAAYRDTLALFDYGFTHFETRTVAASSAFHAGNETLYVLRETFYFTSRKGEVVTQEVTKAGDLIIKGDHHRFITATELSNPAKTIQQQQIEPEQEAPPTDTPNQTDTVEPLSFFTLSGFLVLLSVAFLLLAYRRSTKTKSLD